MKGQQNFRDKFQDYLSRRLNPKQAQNIIYSSQRAEQKQQMSFLSPNQKYRDNQSSKMSSQRSIDSSNIYFGQSNKTSCRSNNSYGRTTSIRKKRLVKMRQIQQNVCSICLQGYKDRVQMSCGHYFCSQCLQQWICNSNRCPYCRTQCPFYVKKGQKYQIQHKEFQYQPQLVDDGLDYQCYMCQQTNEGDQVLICEGCGLYACHIRCDPRLRGHVPDDDEQWFCHFC